MEFLPIGDTKLKIVLTPQDMREYKIETSSGELRAEGGRRGIWQILDQAKKKVCFDPQGDKILIQFYPMSGGGCEIFVAKLGILPGASANIVAKSERVTMLSKKRNFYIFESITDLVVACKEIMRMSKETSPDSDAYYDGASFCLAIDEYGDGSESGEYPFITEFAHSAPHEKSIYIAEHGELLIKKTAVKVLSEL